MGDGRSGGEGFARGEGLTEGEGLAGGEGFIGGRDEIRCRFRRWRVWVPEREVRRVTSPVNVANSDSEDASGEDVSNEDASGECVWLCSVLVGVLSGLLAFSLLILLRSFELL